MSDRPTHDCPVRACTGKRKEWQLVCLGHWRRVPKALRDEIWRLYQNERGSAAHLAAISAALRLLNEMEVAHG